MKQIPAAAAVGISQAALSRIEHGGFAAPQSCTAIRRRRSSLIVPGGLPITARVTGDALTVLHIVITDWPT